MVIFYVLFKYYFNVKMIVIICKIALIMEVWSLRLFSLLLQLAKLPLLLKAVRFLGDGKINAKNLAFNAELSLNNFKMAYAYLAINMRHKSGPQTLSSQMMWGENGRMKYPLLHCWILEKNFHLLKVGSKCG